MKISDLNEEPVQPPARELTQSDLNKLEFYADKLFKSIGIDINFTRHFLDRVNDERNGRQITLPELGLLFRDEYKRWGKKIAQLGPDSEAVMKDMRSDVNVPFVLNWDSKNQELDLVAKTVMRKRGFKTPDPEFTVETTVTEGWKHGIYAGKTKDGVGFKVDKLSRPKNSRYLVRFSNGAMAYYDDFETVTNIVNQPVDAALSVGEVMKPTGRTAFNGAHQMIASVKESQPSQKAEELVKAAQVYLATRRDSMSSVAIMKKGDAYDSVDTGAPGFHQKANAGWVVVAYVEGNGTKIRTDTPHRYLKKLIDAAPVSEAAKSEIKQPGKKQEASEGVSLTGEIINESPIETADVSKDWKSYLWGANIHEYLNSEKLDNFGSVLGMKIWRDTVVNGQVNLYLTDKADLIVGTIVLYRGRGYKAWQVHASALAPKLRGKGVMPAWYAWLVHNGYMLQADSQQSPGGANIWKQMTDRDDITVYAARRRGGKWEYTNVEPSERRVAGSFDIYKDDVDDELDEIGREIGGLMKLKDSIHDQFRATEDKKIQATLRQDYLDVDDRIAALRQEKTEILKSAKKHENSPVFLLAVPAKASVTESANAKMDDMPRRATRGLHTYHDASGQNNDYTQYRLGLALAMADGKNKIELDAVSWAGKKKTAHPYTREEADMLRQAYAAIGAAYEDLNGDDMTSEEAADVNQVSPVAKAKRNRYGV